LASQQIPLSQKNPEDEKVAIKNQIWGSRAMKLGTLSIAAANSPAGGTRTFQFPLFSNHSI
jgi:hypothetical protein